MFVLDVTGAVTAIEVYLAVSVIVLFLFCFFNRGFYRSSLAKPVFMHLNVGLLFSREPVEY